MTHSISPDPLNDPLEDVKISFNLHVSPTYFVNTCSGNTSKSNTLSFLFCLCFLGNISFKIARRGVFLCFLNHLYSLKKGQDFVHLCGYKITPGALY